MLILQWIYNEAQYTGEIYMKILKAICSAAFRSFLFFGLGTFTVFNGMG